MKPECVNPNRLGQLLILPAGHEGLPDPGVDDAVNDEKNGPGEGQGKVVIRKL